MFSAGTRLMGVLNVTPDSFSDGAKYVDVQTAVARGLEMQRFGASIIDVGGESTRPGATLVGAEEEQRRAIEVVAALAKSGITVSIDTLRASTAEAAVSAGARIINDVSGGTYDPAMYASVARLASSHNVTYIIGHWRGVPDTKHEKSVYEDVVHDVSAALLDQARAAIAAGVPASNIVLDPGLGFDKNTAQSWELLRRFDELKRLGFPVCVGVSRKRMLGDIVLGTSGDSGQFTDRDLPTAAVTALAARAGASIVRVHDVLGSAQALEVVRLWGDPPANNFNSAPQDKITLTGLEVFAHHGVFDFERQNGQKFLIDIEIVTDMAPAIRGDALAETVHYGELAERVSAAVSQNPVDLIETVADRIANIALEFAATHSVTVTVHKPDAPIEQPFADVSATVTRSRAEA